LLLSVLFFPLLFHNLSYNIHTLTYEKLAAVKGIVAIISFFLFFQNRDSNCFDHNNIIIILVLFFFSEYSMNLFRGVVSRFGGAPHGGVPGVGAAL